MIGTQQYIHLHSLYYRGAHGVGEPSYAPPPPNSSLIMKEYDGIIVDAQFFICFLFLRYLTVYKIP